MEEEKSGAAISFLLSLRSSYHTFAVNFYHLFFCKMIKLFVVAVNLLVYYVTI